MATGVKNSRSSTAGPTITACPAPSGISCRKMNRRRIVGAGGPPMSAIVLFMAGIAAIAGWWLSQQGLTAKPWLEEGVTADLREHSTSSLPPAKIGLGVFLAVVGSLFALFISAYSMRMTMVDWRALPVPKLLW